MPVACEVEAVCFGGPVQVHGRLHRAKWTIIAVPT